MSRVLLLILLALCCLADGTSPLESVTKYSAQASLGAVHLGADFLGHFVPVGSSAVRSDEYLVVEVAVFAPATQKIELHSSQFALNVNGKRLESVPAGYVTMSLLVPESRGQHTRVDAGGELGGVEVGTRPEVSGPRFPGDTNPENMPVHVPPTQPDNPTGKLEAPTDPVKAVKEAALPEGSHATPISGYLFFPFTGKLKHIKHLDMEYASPLGSAKLAFR